MKRTIQLSKTVTGVVPASGNLTLSTGPSRYGDRWDVNNAAVQSTSITLVPGATLSVAGVVQAATFTGTGDSTSVTASLWQGQIIAATWTGADVGSTCTLSVYGTREIVGG